VFDPHAEARKKGTVKAKEKAQAWKRFALAEEQRLSPLLRRKFKITRAKKYWGASSTTMRCRPL
jgi:hypothetical protein